MKRPVRPDHDFGDPPQSTVGRDSQIEAAIAECGAQRVRIERVGVDMLDRGRDFVDLVTPRMEHRDGIAAPQQAVDDEMAARPGTTNH